MCLPLSPQTEDNEKEINRLSTFPFPPCMNSINRRFNTEWVHKSHVQPDYMNVFTVLNLISLFPHWKGLIWTPGAVMRTITLQVCLILSCLTWTTGTVCFCVWCTVNCEAARCLQVGRASRLCGIPGTLYTLISSPLTWSTCLQSLHTNRTVPTLAGRSSQFGPLSMKAAKNVVKALA